MAYLLGWTAFRSRRFTVTSDVLVPRDDTEVLVDAGLTLCRRAYATLQRPLIVVDAGTGSGIVAVTLALELDVPALLIGADRSAAALRIAASNAAALNADVHFVEGDWLQAFAPRSVDVLLSNPPYIAVGDPHLPALAQEPVEALVAGVDGLDEVRALIDASASVLQRSAAIALEHGFDQGAAVRTLLTAAGCVGVATRRDPAGHERVSCGISPVDGDRDSGRSGPAAH